MKKNFIDSIIAHDHIEHIKQSALKKKRILLTENIKDFAWLKNEGFFIYNNLQSFLDDNQKSTRDEKTNEHIFDAIKDTIFKNNNLRQISDAVISNLMKNEYIEIKSSN